MWVTEAIVKDTPYTREGTGFENATTRNRLTLLALREALKALKDGTRAEIYTDNPNIMFAIREGWIYRWAMDGWARSQTKAGKKYYLPLENADLWQDIYYQLESHEITWADGADSYREYMRTELRRNSKRIEIQQYKRILEGG